MRNKIQSEIITILIEIRDDLRKLTTQVQMVQGRDYQQDAAQMVSGIMKSITQDILGGQNGQ
jgi:hypothetical protein